MPIEVPLNLAYVHELAGSPRETYSRSGFSAERLFLLPWEMRIAFASAALPIGGLIPTLAARYPGRTDALVENISFEPYLGKGSCPSLQSFNNLAVDLNEYEGFGPGSTNGCLAKITYSKIKGQSPPEEQEDGTSIRYSRNSTHQIITLPSRQLKWPLESGSTAYISEDAIAGIIDTIVEHSLTWSNVVYPPWSAIKEMHGAVNVGLFVFPASRNEYGLPESLQFDGSSASFEFNVDDDVIPTFELTYTFRERTTTAMLPDGGVTDIGWNHVYRDDDKSKQGWFKPEWFYPELDFPLGPYPMLQRKDFSRLFIQGG